MWMVRYFWLIAFVALGPTSFESAIPDNLALEQELQWVDDVYNEMTLDQRLGQLFMIRAFSKGERAHEKYIKALIKDEGIGGLCFFQGSPDKQVELTNTYQSLAKVPLLISIDAEWGLGMRFKDRTISFPRQLTLGAIKDNRSIYRFGKEVAKQLRRMGIHMNFAPVVDINNNPQNPVINDRSFGEDRRNVTAKGYAYMKGMQDGGVLACAKHFPGHGDTDTDSHYDLPVIDKSKAQLDSMELFPFKVLAQHDIASVMIAHLSLPTLDTASNTPSTLSKSIVTDILKEELKFDGLVVTDALDMQGMTKFQEVGELEARAIEAGNDILLLSTNVKLAKEYIKAYIEDGRISEGQIESSVKKILTSKYRLGLNQTPSIKEDNLYNDLISAQALALKGRLYEQAFTLVRDNQKLVPIENVIGKNIACISIGAPTKTTFQKRLDSYARVTHFNTGLMLSQPRFDGVKGAMADKDLVIISLHDYNKRPKDQHGVGFRSYQLIEELSMEKKVIVVLFGSPYILSELERIPNVIVAYEDDELAQDFAAQALFGVTPITGRLPVNAGKKSVLGSGLDRLANGRLGYVIPEVVGLNSDTLMKIDSIVEEMIKKRAAPGCQILVAKDGRVVHHKAYGSHAYNNRKVQLNDVYDVASITKIAATTISLMKLYEDGELDITAPLKKYLPDLDTTNKGDLIISDVLAHHARLLGWLPFYKNTLAGKKLDYRYYRIDPEDGYSLQVCEKIYLRDDFLDTIYTQIVCSDLRDTNTYRYSDLGFYLFDRLIHNLSGQTLDEYVQKSFYDPMGLRYIGFNPTKKGIPKSMIPPTEKDRYYRNKTVQGYVHDMGAAMQAGVAGHAGLFTNAHDLAIIMQMLINDGTYGGVRLLKPETVERFTKRHPLSTRRGLGFDMKELDTEKTENMCSEASSQTFGHLGFTGTATWADPANGIVFVFLSNRTYPTMENKKLLTLNYRPKIQSLVYRAMMEE